MKTKILRTIAILTTLMLIGLTATAQEPIARGVYAYGKLESCINGKTLVYYDSNDYDAVRQVVYEANKYGLKSKSWYTLFIPGQKYTDEERYDILSENNIETVFIVKHNSSSSSQQGTAYSNGLGGYTMSSGTVVSHVGLLYEVYSVKDKFDKPIVVINGNGKNNPFITRSGFGMTLKTTERVVKAMRKNGAIHKSNRK